MQKYWSVGFGKKIELQAAPILMGILNVTPDSFSDGGVHNSVELAIAHAYTMQKFGAHIIDIGGESTRPGFATLSVYEEQERVLPIFTALHNKIEAYLSIDTYHAQTAKIAIEAGAHIVNDIWGLQKEPEIADIVAQYKSGIIIMHNSRDRDVLSDVIEDQKYYFDKSLEIAKKAGIDEKSIVLDPGFGFGKDTAQNIALLKRAEELNSFGFPLLAATSRKRFVGEIALIEQASARDVATAATSVLLRQKGFLLFRVHDIAINRQALAILDAVSL